MLSSFSKFGLHENIVEQYDGSAMALTNKAKLSLYKKSTQSSISTDILEEVYRRGYSIWNKSFGDTPEQFAFDRVNSFIAGGFAAQLDEDLVEDKPTDRLVGTKSLTNNYKKTTPGQTPISIIKKIIKENRIHDR